ncbi:MAG: DUF4424 family protein [Hyphomicrobiales bacterium]
MSRLTGTFLAALVLYGLPSGAALANDSSAELAAGGLMLVRNYEIRMESEVLRISPAEVTVDYVFRNVSDKDQTILVAFPLPDLDMDELADVPIDAIVNVPVNFVDFTVTVDGKPVAYQTEQKAYAAGLDVTDTLKADHVPLNPLLDGIGETIAGLPAGTRADYAIRGIAEWMDESYATPRWLLKTTFWWRQTFPAGKTVAVRHAYKPVVGSSFYYPSSAGDEFAEYCMDEGTGAAVAKALADDNQEFMYTHRLSYILRTARNWSSDIGSFRLIIDKTDPHWFLSLCLDGIKKTGDTTFEFEATNFVPEKDLKILFLEPVEAP